MRPPLTQGPVFVAPRSHAQSSAWLGTGTQAPQLPYATAAASFLPWGAVGRAIMAGVCRHACSAWAALSTWTHPGLHGSPEGVGSEHTPRVHTCTERQDPRRHSGSDTRKEGSAPPGATKQLESWPGRADTQEISYGSKVAGSKANHMRMSDTDCHPQHLQRSQTQTIRMTQKMARTSLLCSLKCMSPWAPAPAPAPGAEKRLVCLLLALSLPDSPITGLREGWLWGQYVPTPDSRLYCKPHPQPLVALTHVHTKVW